MRRSIAAMTLAAAVLAPPSATAQDRGLETFAWLAGAWEMHDGARVVEEHWTAPSANLMIGMSRAVAGGRTTEFEFIRLEKRDDGLFYVPQPGGRPPVAFRLTSADGDRFVFENTTSGDRVTRVEYRRDGPDGLHARVEGAREGRPFVLEYRYTRRRP
jgi:hypothetical protein